MNFETLSTVKFGDVDSLGEFLFENGTQHKLFQETFMDLGISVPVYPITDASVDNLDDWLLANQVEHQAFSTLLGLNNPFNMLDVDFNNEEDFYDWIASHLYIHQQIAAGTGIAVVPERIKAARSLSSSLLHPPAPASPSPLSPQMVVPQASLSLLVQPTAPAIASPKTSASVPHAVMEAVSLHDNQSFSVPHIQGLGPPAKHPSPTPSALSTEKGESRQFFWGNELRQSVLSSRRDSSRLTDASDVLDRHAHPSVTTLASTEGGSALDMSLSSDGSEHGLQLLPLSDTLLSVDTHDAASVAVPAEANEDELPGIAIDEIHSVRATTSAQADGDVIHDAAGIDGTAALCVEVDVLHSETAAAAPPNALVTIESPPRALRVPIRNVQRVLAVTKAIPQYDDSKF